MQAPALVRYRGGKESIEGYYPLVIFENNVVPVLGGREEDGMPKAVCGISLDRH
ncbi:MAG: acetoacetate decarboxylase family protein [Synergistes jonesii]|uniref:acetoacetate decarboxylase family protein n=1 Tax=Synergistes jonesii TaxID=2754 RepID=UPI002A76120A|nr:acetoacetate decarboxylase family protein [Synergistes jonesii]MDY2984903.1 acetoacetate decarboxylase family protein [Synergistes jonesii]